jgi:hypothetical protein
MFTEKELQVLQLALKEFSKAFEQSKISRDTKAAVEKSYDHEEIIDFLSIAKNLQDRFYYITQDRNVLLDGIARLNYKMQEILPEIK